MIKTLINVMVHGTHLYSSPKMLAAFVEEVAKMAHSQAHQLKMEVVPTMTPFRIHLAILAPVGMMQTHMDV